MSGAAKRAGPWRSAGRPSGTAAVGGAGGPQGGMRAVAVRYPVASFVVLAFVVSWAGLGPLLADR
jgi:hypothetical protein